MRYDQIKKRFFENTYYLFSKMDEIYEKLLRGQQKNHQTGKKNAEASQKRRPQFSFRSGG